MGLVLSPQAEPAASIVIARDSPPAVHFAAAELSRYLAIITGGHFPVTERPEPGAPALRLGVCLPNAPRLPANGSYGWAVRADEVSISGAAPGAVLHAVYAFLENLGCVWLHHREGGEIVPRLPQVVLPAGEHTARPAFAHREFTNLYPLDREYTLMIDWLAKNRLNRFMVFANLAGGVETYRQLLEPEMAARGMSATVGHHSFRYFLPPEEFFDHHPDYYALVGGERTPHGQLCTSNPAVVATVAERICELLAAHPTVEMVGLWPNDGFGWCECERCARLEPDRPSAWPGGHPCRSDTNLRFVNAVAALVAQQFPDRRLSALAYLNYADPPLHVVPADNVAVCFAPMSRCLKHPLAPDVTCERANAAYARLVQRWREITSNALYLFCYLMQIHRLSLPYPITHMLPAELAWQAQVGVDGYVAEFVPQEWGTFGVNAHLMARLSWEPDLDLEDWLQRHCQHLYGPAAADMCAYLEALEQAIRVDGPCTGHYDYRFTLRATEELMRPVLEPLGRARALAATGEKRHWQATQQAALAAQLLLRVGQWQRLVRAGAAERADQVRQELLAWVLAHADRGALDLRYLERVLGA